MSAPRSARKARAWAQERINREGLARIAAELPAHGLNPHDKFH